MRINRRTAVKTLPARLPALLKSKLFVRLAQYGICGNLLTWLENFFTKRSHQTRVNASLSDASALYSGVVQGSGIGPVAFLIYVDDLAEVLLQYGVRAVSYTHLTLPTILRV